MKTYTPENTNDDQEWSWEDFRYHYYNGEGQAVNLNDIGLRDDVRESQLYLDMISRYYDQLAEIVRAEIANNNLGSGEYVLNYETSNGYKFTFESVDLFPLGTATMETWFDGSFTIDANGEISLNGDLHVEFYDYFEDALDLPNWVDGVYNPEGSTPFEISDQWHEELNMVNIHP